jgi:3,4-dihydroxy-2-butanone 4-phosphate synthase/GTP cyclohydrolase II
MPATGPSATLRRIVSTAMPTRWGVFQVEGFEFQRENRRTETAIALVMGDMKERTPLVRIHSQCFTGEMLGSLRCDCGDQLQMAMRTIAQEGCGAVIYEYQEGRGIGLMPKLQAYALQDRGLDTFEANQALGFPGDCRDFALPAAILRELGISRVRLMTNNLQKVHAVVGAGIDVVAQLPCEVAPSPHSLAYLRAKKEKMGHFQALQPYTGTGYARDPVGNELFEFATIDRAIGELQAGRMVVIVDDEDRENEGDLLVAADMVTPEAINFMATNARGLICLAMTDERLEELELDPMVSDNTALHGTAFTVSIDAISQGITTGISASDRAHTIRAAVDPNSSPEDFARPGHVFPLRARIGGVLERRGQTEAAVDLAHLAGLSPAGVICEIVNDDGTMARLPDLARFCKTHNLLMVSVADLARYRLDTEPEEAITFLDALHC